MTNIRPAAWRATPRVATVTGFWHPINGNLRAHGNPSVFTSHQPEQLDRPGSLDLQRRVKCEGLSGLQPRGPRWTLVSTIRPQEAQVSREDAQTRMDEEEGSPSDGRANSAGEEILFSKHPSIISAESFLHWNTHTHTYPYISIFVGTTIDRTHYPPPYPKHSHPNSTPPTLT